MRIFSSLSSVHCVVCLRYTCQSFYFSLSYFGYCLKKSQGWTQDGQIQMLSSSGWKTYTEVLRLGGHIIRGGSSGKWTRKIIIWILQWNVGYFNSLLDFNFFSIFIHFFSTCRAPPGYNALGTVPASLHDSLTLLERPYHFYTIQIKPASV